MTLDWQRSWCNQHKHREIIITGIQDTKATRGTKRVCPACETRFYDLARERIICPSCGEEYALVVGVATSPTGKTAWRRKAVKQSKPPLSKSDRAETLPGVASDVADEAPDTGHGDDDLVLEQEPDETDVTHLIEHVEEPTERK
jgi:uncharacterized protein (TIGR02300 family)